MRLNVSDSPTVRNALVDRPTEHECLAYLLMSARARYTAERSDVGACPVTAQRSLEARFRMPVRVFRDSEGIQWTVWAVLPSAEERRSEPDRRALRDRRGADSPTPPDVDRRSGFERRQTPRRRAAPLPGYELGWLCFEGGGQRRRLAPIPPDWERCSSDALNRYRAEAEHTRPPSRPAP